VASVYRDRRRGKPAWASGFLIGGQPAARFEVGGLDGAKAVELLTDFGHEGRPEGADPLDIRDELVWARPMFVVKPPDRGPDDVWRAAMPAAAGWAPVTDDADAVRYRRDRLVSGRYASVAVVPPGGAVALGCDVTEPQAAALTLRVELTGVAAPVRVTAEANDEPVDLTIDGRPQDGGGVIEKPGVSELVVGVPGEAGGSREVRLVFTSDKPARGAAEAGLYVHDTSTATTPAAGESDGGPP